MARLSDLPPGSEARVEALCVGEKEESLLCAIGLRPSCRLRVCVNRGACIVQVGFTRIAVSREIGRLIVVTPRD